MLLMSTKIRQQIQAHAAQAFPEECCGVLLGVRDKGILAIQQAIPAPNTAPAESRATRYVIDPRDILQADKVASRDHLDIVGFYHSHPDHPAVPSKTDLALSWPDYVYLIASVGGAGQAELRAWQLPGLRQPMQEISITISEAIRLTGDPP